MHKICKNLQIKYERHIHNMQHSPIYDIYIYIYTRYNLMYANIRNDVLKTFAFKDLEYPALKISLKFFDLRTSMFMIKYPCQPLQRRDHCGQSKSTCGNCGLHWRFGVVVTGLCFAIGLAGAMQL